MRNLYFDVQAKVGISKHIYGLKGTKELCNLCGVDSTKTVLVIGSGNGASALKIGEIFGSQVVGVDIHPEMVKAAEEYCEKKKAHVEFIVGDALDLSFENNTFDVVISESVTAFVSDKNRAIKEYKRVTKKGGYIGLGEITWLGNPSKEVIDFAYEVMGGLRPESKSDWENLLRFNQLEIIFSRAEKLKKFKQAIGELQMMNLADYIEMFYKFLVAYCTSSSYRAAVHTLAKAFMKRPRGYMNMFGAGMYVAKK